MAFSLFKKKKEKKDNRYQTLAVKEVVNVAKDAVNLAIKKDGVNNTDSNGHSPLFVSAQNGHLKVIKTLLQNEVCLLL